MYLKEVREKLQTVYESVAMGNSNGKPRYSLKIEYAFNDSARLNPGESEW